METKLLQKYVWSDLSPVLRQYLVQDDQGRLGIGVIDPVYHGPNVMFVRPANVDRTIEEEIIGEGTIIMTETAWHLYHNTTYKGMWYDDRRTGWIREEELRSLEIISDLGWYAQEQHIEEMLETTD